MASEVVGSGHQPFEPAWSMGTCERCGAFLVWHVGPQWSGWRAPKLDGALRDVCYRDAENVWQGHRPAE